MCVLIFPEAESLLHLFFFFLYSLLILLAEFSLFSTSMTRKRKKKNRCSRSRSKAQHSTRLLLLRENPITGLVQLPTARSSLLPSPAFFSSSYRLMWTVPVQINQAGRQWNQRECTSLSGLLRFSLSLAHKRRLIILLIVEQTSEGKRRPLHSLNTCELTAEAAGAGLDSFLFGYKSPSFFFLLFLFFSLVTHWVSVPVILLFYWRPMMGQCLPCYCCAWSMRRRRNRCREARRGVRHGTARTGRNNPQRIKKHSSRNLAVIAIPNTAQLQTRGNKKQQNRKIKRRKAISCCNAMAKSLGTQKYEQRIILPLG